MIKRKLVLIIATLLSIGCTNTTPTIAKQEHKKVYVDKFPIQTYKEYLALDKFTLDKYLPVGADKNNGTGFLTFFKRWYKNHIYY